MGRYRIQIPRVYIATQDGYADRHPAAGFCPEAAMCSVKWGLLGWSKHVGYRVLRYQPENVEKHVDILGW